MKIRSFIVCLAKPNLVAQYQRVYRHKYGRTKIGSVGLTPAVGKSGELTSEYMPLRNCCYTEFGQILRAIVGPKIRVGWVQAPWNEDLDDP